MNKEQIRNFVLRYLEARRCHILEKSPNHVTVKLSPEADKDLTNRAYYWNFVERTGAEPETMTFTFLFEPEAQEDNPADPNGRAPAHGRAANGSAPSPAGIAGSANGNVPSPAGMAGPANGTAPHTGRRSPLAEHGAHPGNDSILGRYFGVSVPPLSGRIPRETMVFGCRRLEQIFTSVRNHGKYVNLFEIPETNRQAGSPSLAYATWLCVNYKVELACDMKRDELHSLGIHLATGTIIERFHERMLLLRLSPQLPANIYLQPNKMTLERATALLETYLEHKLKQYDHAWAHEAQKRLQEELDTVHAYYYHLMQSVEPDQRMRVQEQYFNRQKEIEWQYRPRIRATVVNSGLFHLKERQSLTPDESR